MADELAAPLLYDPRWAVLLGGIVLVAVVSPLAARLLRSGWRPRPRVATATERSRVIARIDAIAASRHTTAEAQREAHAALSTLVRDFVSASGSGVDGRTLSELERGDLVRGATDPALLEAVRLFNDGAFAGRPQASVADSVAAARRVVTSWAN